VFVVSMLFDDHRVREFVEIIQHEEARKAETAQTETGDPDDAYDPAAAYSTDTRDAGTAGPGAGSA